MLSVLNYVQQRNAYVYFELSKKIGQYLKFRIPTAQILGPPLAWARFHSQALYHSLWISLRYLLRVLLKHGDEKGESREVIAKPEL